MQNWRNTFDVLFSAGSHRKQQNPLILPKNKRSDMRASIEQVIASLGNPSPPEKIVQDVFEGDITAYIRLCSLHGKDPNWHDLFEPIQDMCYLENLQADLIRYVFPICLRGWALDLMDEIDIDGLVENFWLALAGRTEVWEILGSEGSDAVSDFMRDTILDRMDREHELSFSGRAASPYAWFHALGSYTVVFPSLDSLWEIWWEMGTSGLAASALQYASCLMYENDRNPIFSPWTPTGGGGPPALWEVDGAIYEQAAHPDNIAFLEHVLTPEYLQSKIQKAATILRGRARPSPQLRRVIRR